MLRAGQMRCAYCGVWLDWPDRFPVRTEACCEGCLRTVHATRAGDGMVWIAAWLLGMVAGTTAGVIGWAAGGTLLRSGVIAVAVMYAVTFGLIGLARRRIASSDGG